ncbi:hypothetical protein [Rubrobacter calidifluminis]|nr:hypothetical protein [Rubrobacter calidifluminis]
MPGEASGIEDFGEVTFKRADGTEVNLTELHGGRPLVLAFLRHLG